MTEKQKKQMESLASVAGAFEADGVELNDADRAAVANAFGKAKLRQTRAKVAANNKPPTRIIPTGAAARF